MTETWTRDTLTINVMSLASLASLATHRSFRIRVSGLHSFAAGTFLRLFVVVGLLAVSWRRFGGAGPGQSAAGGFCGGGARGGAAGLLSAPAGGGGEKPGMLP